jgi:hypothetical protein
MKNQTLNRRAFIRNATLQAAGVGVIYIIGCCRTLYSQTCSSKNKICCCWYKSRAHLWHDQSRYAGWGRVSFFLRQRR